MISHPGDQLVFLIPFCQGLGQSQCGLPVTTGQTLISSWPLLGTLRSSSEDSRGTLDRRVQKGLEQKAMSASDRHSIGKIPVGSEDLIQYFLSRLFMLVSCRKGESGNPPGSHSTGQSNELNLEYL